MQEANVPEMIRLAPRTARNVRDEMAFLQSVMQTVIGDERVSADVRDKLTMIKMMAGNVSQLARQFLIITGTQDEILPALDMQDTILQLTPLIERLLSKNNRLQTLLDDGLWLVQGDAKRFVPTCLIPLLANANEAMPGGGTLYIRARNVTKAQSQAQLKSAAFAADYVLVEVTDERSAYRRRLCAGCSNHLRPPKATGLWIRQRKCGTLSGVSMVISFANRKRDMERRSRCFYRRIILHRCIRLRSEVMIGSKSIDTIDADPMLSGSHFFYAGMTIPLLARTPAADPSDAGCDLHLELQIARSIPAKIERLPPISRRPAVPLLRVSLLFVALVSSAVAQTAHYDGPALLPVIKDVANQLQLYLDYVAKSGGRPDFSAPPASDQFNRLFDPDQLAALPPPKASDVTWLMDWTATANGIAKAILYFGIAPPADPVADAAAIKRNMTDYEDQQAAAMSFMVRLQARDMQPCRYSWSSLRPSSARRSEWRATTKPASAAPKPFSAG